MKHLLTALLISATLGTCVPALADYVGPNGTPGTIRQLLDSGWDHQFVTLKGNITRRVAHDDLYEFSDGTGTIYAEIKRKRFVWPVSTPVSDKTRVEIYGKYIRQVWGPTKIEVIDMRVAD